MKRLLLVLALVATTSAAQAAPRKVLVLRADGRADAAARGRVDAAVLALVKQQGGDVTQADIAFSDAAAAVGCGDDTVACGPQLPDGLGADEVVVVMVSPVPGGELSVTVVRASRDGVRDGSVTVPAADPAPGLAKGLGALFGASATTPPRPDAGSTVAPPPTGPDPIASTEPGLGAVTAPPATNGTTVAPTGVMTAPEGRRSNKMAIAAVGTGGGLVLFGLLLWGKAAGLADQIQNAPTRTRDDLLALQSLEDRADGYALAGNILVPIGLAVAGYGGYLFWRDRHHASQAALAPVPMGHGAGLVLTIGGSP